MITPEQLKVLQKEASRSMDTYLAELAQLPEGLLSAEIELVQKHRKQEQDWFTKYLAFINERTILLGYYYFLLKEKSNHKTRKYEHNISLKDYCSEYGYEEEIVEDLIHKDAQDVLDTNPFQFLRDILGKSYKEVLK